MDRRAQRGRAQARWQGPPELRRPDLRVDHHRLGPAASLRRRGHARAGRRGPCDGDHPRGPIRDDDRALRAQRIPRRRLGVRVRGARRGRPDVHPPAGGVRPILPRPARGHRGALPARHHRRPGGDGDPPRSDGPRRRRRAGRRGAARAGRARRPSRARWTTCRRPSSASAPTTRSTGSRSSRWVAASTWATTSTGTMSTWRPSPRPGRRGWRGRSRPARRRRPAGERDRRARRRCALAPVSPGTGLMGQALMLGLGSDSTFDL